jgi:ATP-dependent DNA helicase RecG
MGAFRDGELHALVTTTVIEVGIDVSNATLMAVYNADRFGLSQLHQLRGRISRGKFQGYCFLFTQGTQAEGLKRLAALEETSDGFRIAEVDFELRGPGDVLGTRQSGAMPLRFADLVRDQAVLEEARAVAFDLVKSGEWRQPEFAALRQAVLDRFGRLYDLPQAG